MTSESDLEAEGGQEDQARVQPPPGAATAGVDWDAIAAQIVKTMCVEAGERVVLAGDPAAYPEVFEAVRLALLRAGAIDHATVPAWNGRLARERTEAGTNPDAVGAGRERHALLDLLHTADVFMWLPNDFWATGTNSTGVSEWALGRWRGRGHHFHWMPDYLLPRDHPVQIELQRLLQKAILELDYDAHRERQKRVLDAVRGRELRITTPDGTDVRLALEGSGWYHLNDGRSDRAKQLRAVCARDREEELPCGMIRTIPRIDSVAGVVRYHRNQGIAGSQDLSEFTDDLEVVITDGRITGVHGGGRDAELQKVWRAQTGDFDRVTEVVFGTNPVIGPTPLAGGKLPPSWCAGAGGFRLHTGSNTESGGTCEASLSLELFMSDASVYAGTDCVIEHGQLVVP